MGSGTFFWTPWAMHACGAGTHAETTFTHKIKQIKKVLTGGDLKNLIKPELLLRTRISLTDLKRVTDEENYISLN